MTRRWLLLLSLVSPLVLAQAQHSLELLQQAGQRNVLTSNSEESEQIIPRYLLQDPLGRAVSNEDFRGRYQLIAFGYTYCPDICPTTLVEMAEVLKLLASDADLLQAIFITVDPERDNGKVLKTYTEFFDRRILGLTGSPQLVRRAADNFRIRYAKVPGSDGNYAVDHAAGMILLGPDGRVARKYAYGTSPQEIAEHLRSAIRRRQAAH
ncbi:SCO family protein [Dechloromonas sp. ZY10]|uniref:SCO family protein n=1 Tax=Dechloromonas aquae TaxID=2664436 RepID=UPI003528A095